MRDVAIKIVFCLCAATFAFAADSMPDALRYHQSVIAKLEAARLEKLAQRVFNPEKTAQLQSIYDENNGLDWTVNRSKIIELLQAGADPEVKRGFGDACFLSRASLYGDEPVMHSLLQACANPNSIERIFNKTPLFCVRRPKEAELLIAYGADLSHKAYLGNLLHNVAMHYKDPSLTLLYCNTGVIDPNEKNDLLGITALQAFCSLAKFHNQKKTEISLKILLLAGGDLSVEDAAGRTPLTIIQKECPALVASIIAFHEKVPAIKAAKKAKLKDLLTKTGYLNFSADLTEIVVGYVEMPGISMQDVQEEADASALLLASVEEVKEEVHATRGVMAHESELLSKNKNAKEQTGCCVIL